MKEIYKNLFIGTDYDCNPSLDFAVIHACKTCHQKALGYTKSLNPMHPHYLIYEKETNLFLNLVDMPNELLPKLHTSINDIRLCSLLNTYINKQKIIIHCNQGMSRSPSIGLVYLAKIGAINKKIHIEMQKLIFYQLYPEYNPGKGIVYICKIIGMMF
jgi:predicted protein tyrosine phosphatase